MLATTVTLFLLASMLQAEALPTKKQVNCSVNKRISQDLVVFNAEKVTSFISEHSDILEELIPSVASTIYKMATCKTETKALVLPHIEDVMACINITISVYDMEIFLYRAFQFGLEVYDNILDLGSDVLECRDASSNIFGQVECAFDTVKNSSSLFHPLLNRVSELVLEIENDVHGLMDNVHECVGSTSASVFEAWHIFKTQC